MNFIKLIIVISMLCVTSISRGQFVHININNTDTSTRAKLLAMGTSAGITDLMLLAMKGDINDTGKEMDKLLRQSYKSNTFDKKHRNDYIKKNVFAAVHTIMSETTKRVKKLPYMTENKKEYLEELNSSKLVALVSFIQDMGIASQELIKGDNRQEIYRLRAEIMALLSKDDQEVRKNLMLPIGAYSYKNRDKIIDQIRKLNSPLIIK